MVVSRLLSTIDDAFCPAWGIGNQLADLSCLQVREYAITSLDGICELALHDRFAPRESAVGMPGQFTVIPCAGMRAIDQMRGDFVACTARQPLLGTQATILFSQKCGCSLGRI